MVLKDMKKDLEFSIARAEGEILCCNKELGGDMDDLLHHRNLFHHIARIITLPRFYFDDTDAEYQRLRDVAKGIFEERARDYDSICRNYVNVETMIEVFQRSPAADGSSILLSTYARDLRAGGLINGAHMLTYGSILIKSGSSSGFEAYTAVWIEFSTSEFRRDSVQREIKVFQDYIALCQKRLAALS